MPRIIEPGYTFTHRARAFVRGLSGLEPMVSVAREGLEREGLGWDQRVDYALRISEASTSGCSEIARIIGALAKGAQGDADGPYRSSPLVIEIPPLVQDRLCELYRKKYGEAMVSHLAHERGAESPEDASRIVDSRIASRLEKAGAAYGLLKCGAITSQSARRHLTAVFCDAARDVLVGGMLFSGDADGIREAVIREFKGENIRAIIPYGLSAYDAGRMITIVSKELCGADMSLPER